MIIKLIETKEQAKSTGRYARNLAIYMANADPRRLRPDAIGLDYGLTLGTYLIREPEAPVPPQERVLFRSALIGGAVHDWEAGIAEMERRLKKRSSRVKKPVRHVVLSYRVGEQPDEAQCRDAVAALVHELGCEKAAVLWAAHADTDNIHIHALFVTVDAETATAVPFGQGRNGQAAHKEAMQRAIALIEHKQRLKTETGARYEVVDGHLVRRLERPARARTRPQIRQEILKFEEESGFASFTRVAQDVAGPILDEASSWHQLHQDLARHGMSIRPSVNGGELFAGDDHVKLSNVDRRHSWPKLLSPTRLGPYGPPENLPPTPYEPVIIDGKKAAHWVKRQDASRAITDRIDHRVAAMMTAREVAVADALNRMAAHRHDVAGFDGDPRLGRDLTAAWPRLRASTASMIKEAFAARIHAVRGLRHAIVDFQDLDLVDLDAIGAIDLGIVSPWYGEHAAPTITPLDRFAGELAGKVVRYWSIDDTDRRRQPALVDAGAIIWVNDRSERVVEAALTLARQRFGDVAVFGDEAYVEQCRRAAVRLGIELEIITVKQAKARVRSLNTGRARSRRRSIETHNLNDRLRHRRAWARAYARATAEDDDPSQTSSITASIHGLQSHAEIPTVQSIQLDRKASEEFANSEASKDGPAVRRPVHGLSQDPDGIG